VILFESKLGKRFNHSRIIIKALRRGLQIAIDKINELSVKIDKTDMSKQIELLEECAATSMSSKLIHQQKKHFSHLVVKAVMVLDDLLPLNMIGIKKVCNYLIKMCDLLL
jgi:T-complex protein 1 subunit eta